MKYSKPSGIELNSNLPTLRKNSLTDCGFGELHTHKQSLLVVERNIKLFRCIELSIPIFGSRLFDGLTSVELLESSVNTFRRLHFKCWRLRDKVARPKHHGYNQVSLHSKNSVIRLTANLNNSTHRHLYSTSPALRSRKTLLS